MDSFLRRLQRPPSRSIRTARISARIESAVSGCVSAPRSRPHGPEIRSSCLLGDAGLEQALAAALLVPARAERADVERLGLERRLQRRLVELVVVREDDDRGRVVGRDLRERLVRPLDDQLVRARDPLARSRTSRVRRRRSPSSRAASPRGRAPRPCRPRRRRAAAAAAPYHSANTFDAVRARAAGCGRRGSARRTGRAPPPARRRRRSPPSTTSASCPSRRALDHREEHGALARARSPAQPFENHAYNLLRDAFEEVPTARARRRPDEAEAGRRQQRCELRSRALAAARVDQHVQVAELRGRIRVRMRRGPARRRARTCPARAARRQALEDARAPRGPPSRG